MEGITKVISRNRQTNNVTLKHNNQYFRTQHSVVVVFVVVVVVYYNVSFAQVVGISIVRDEEDIEYVRSRFSIEDFVYFDHHTRREHGRLHHFALAATFDKYVKYFLKVKTPYEKVWDIFIHVCALDVQWMRSCPTRNLC